MDSKWIAMGFYGKLRHKNTKYISLTFELNLK
jgi:hypothetical protein